MKMTTARLALALFAAVSGAAYGLPPEQIVERCTAVNHDYAIARDSADRELYARLFTPDAEFTMQGKRYRGRDAILERVPKGEPRYFARLVIGTVRIVPTGPDTAKGRVYFTMFQAPEGPAPQPPIRDFELFMGEYHDEYRLTDGRCRISRRETVPLFWGT